MSTDYDVLIAGGGLAGLTATLLLSRKGYKVALFEKNQYPFHKVCGEYISNESLPFLEKQGVPLNELNVTQINSLRLTSPGGKSFQTKLQMGAFGISHFTLEKMLAEMCKDSGADVFENHTVQDIQRVHNDFSVNVNGQQVTGKIAIGAAGKHSRLHPANHKTTLKHFIGVKYYAEVPLEEDCIEMHLFKNGYCGMMKTDNGKFNICYLVDANEIKKEKGNIKELERNLLFTNPALKARWQQMKFDSEEPLTVSQIYIHELDHHRDGMMMIGDSSGMIAPLCGNGMSIAMHSASISSNLADSYLKGVITESKMHEEYSKQWRKNFSSRIKTGIMLHKLLQYPRLSSSVISLFNKIPSAANFVIAKSHGKEF